MQNSRFIRAPRARIGGHSQQGFVQALLVGGIILLGVIAAAYSYFNRGASSNFDSETNRVNATLVITTGNDLRTAISRWTEDHVGTPVLDSSAGNIYDPALGLASSRTLPPKAFANNTPVAFAMNTADVVIGTDDSVPELAVVVSGLNGDVCRHINRAVNDAAIDAAVPTSYQASGEGCVNVVIGASAASNTYFKVVKFLR